MRLVSLVVLVLWLYPLTNQLYKLFVKENTMADTAKPADLQPNFPVWKTSILGLYKSPEDYGDQLLMTLLEPRFKIGPSSIELLKKISIRREQALVDLVRPSVADLGFTEATKYGDICARAIDYGLELCPPEVGPLLRLFRMDQPDGEWQVVAMPSIRLREDGEPLIFMMGNSNGVLWLNTNSGDPNIYWGVKTLFTFVKPRI